jgi:general secretion pathway protein G
MKRDRGFTLVELVVTLALVGLLALVAIPSYQLITTRMKEAELRLALRTLRSALDAYKEAADGGLIAKRTGESGYPPTLSVLVEGIDAQARNGPLSLVGDRPQRLVFLRQIPRDPFNTDPALPPEQTWRTRAYASPVNDPAPGADVFDVYSSSGRIALDGTAYHTW